MPAVVAVARDVAAVADVKAAQAAAALLAVAMLQTALLPELARTAVKQASPKNLPR